MNYVLSALIKVLGRISGTFISIDWVFVAIVYKGISIY